jgi:hypothetical protein
MDDHLIDNSANQAKSLEATVNSKVKGRGKIIRDRLLSLLNPFGPAEEGAEIVQFLKRYPLSSKKDQSK